MFPALILLQRSHTRYASVYMKVWYSFIQSYGYLGSQIKIYVIHVIKHKLTCSIGKHRPLSREVRCGQVLNRNESSELSLATTLVYPQEYTTCMTLSMVIKAQ